MTYRDRRERRADRLRGWAAGREQKGREAFQKSHDLADQIPLGQPILVGHHSEAHARRDADRITRDMQQGVEHSRKAADHTGKADNIERELRGAIYMDDPDARERLEEKIVTLEAERERRKAINAEARKHKQDKETFLAWLDTQDERTRSDLMSVFNMYQGGLRWVKYDLSNIGGTITKEKQRLAQLTGAPTGKCQNCDYKKPAHDHGIACDNYEAETSASITTRAKAVKVILCRYAGRCADCGNSIERGEQAVHVERGVIRCMTCQEERRS